MKNVSRNTETFFGKVSLTLPHGLSPEQVKDWKRDMSMIVRPIVIITTISKEGVPNAALKTNFMIVSSLEEVAFTCPPEHDTHRNIVETGEFVVKRFSSSSLTPQ